jgi:hypothetical protein
MKTFKLSIIALVLLGAISCKKTDGNSAANTVTSDQAADIAAGSLAANSYGLTSVSDDIAVNAQTLASINTGSQTVNSLGTATVHQACGTTLTDSVTNSGTNSSVSFSYFLKFARTLNCNTNSQPDNLANSVSYHGNFDGPNLTSTNTGSAIFKIAGLTTTAANFVVNGEYKRTGSFQSKIGNKTSGQSSVDIVVTNLTLTKPARKIASGTATIAITGSTTKNGDFSYTGTLLFNGDGTAILTINGNAYTVNLLTGVKIKR